MAQVKECIEKSYECSKLRGAIPRSDLPKFSADNIDCRRKKTDTCAKLKAQYKYVQPCRPKACRPLSQKHTTDASFAGDSVYSCSYERYDVCQPRQKPVKQQDHLIMGGNFQGETVQKLSYPIVCSPVVQKIVPKDHCLGGSGPMRTVTTQNHDYYIPCSGSRPEKVVPRSFLTTSDCPMSMLTTNNCSYQPVCAGRVKSYKPDGCYNVPEGNMDLNTIQRCSFKNQKTPGKLDTPWAVKLEYCKPKKAVECSTIYNYSFKEPGKYVLNDGCCDTVAHMKLGNCCQSTCLADNVEKQFQQQFVKAHQF